MSKAVTLRAQPVHSDPWLYPHALAPLTGSGSGGDQPHHTQQSPRKPNAPPHAATLKQGKSHSVPEVKRGYELAAEQKKWHYSTHARSLDNKPATYLPPAQLDTTHPAIRQGTWTMDDKTSTSRNLLDRGYYDHVPSKVGSLDNVHHLPGGGDVKIVDAPQKFQRKSKVGSLDNVHHVPKGGNVDIVDRPLRLNPQSKVGSLENLKHVPKQNGVQIFNEKPQWKGESKVGSMDNIYHQPKSRVTGIYNQSEYYVTKSKVGSLDNISHQPRGGDVKVFHESRKYNQTLSRVQSLDNVNHEPGGGKVKIMNVRRSQEDVRSRVGSLDNIHHTPRGGDVKIFQQRQKLQHTLPRVGSLDNLSHQAGGGNVRILHDPTNHQYALPKVGSLENFDHIPGGGNVKIFHESPRYHAASKVGSLDNVTHEAGGGQVRIPHRPLQVGHVRSRVGSLERIDHVPGGGQVKIISRKLQWNAKSKIGSLETSESGARIPWRSQSLENIHHSPSEDKRSLRSYQDHVRYIRAHPKAFRAGHVDRRDEMRLYDETPFINRRSQQVRLKPLPAKSLTSRESSEHGIRYADLGYQPKTLPKLKHYPNKSTTKGPEKPEPKSSDQQAVKELDKFKPQETNSKKSNQYTGPYKYGLGQGWKRKSGIEPPIVHKSLASVAQKKSGSAE